MRHVSLIAAALLAAAVCHSAGAAGAQPAEDDQALLGRLDAPLLFVKRLNYQGIHIYDTYYKWRPGGGIYVIENPAAAPGDRKIRPLIDATTPNTLGAGIYSEPELSWDAKRVLFCYKPTADGSTSIYEIGVDGKGLRRLTDPTPYCASYKGQRSGQHDVGPSYLPDGRIVFTSTRLNGLVPCFNTGVDILHVMNADGTGAHAISVNNVNEFDPSVLPDGRILHGRWEYVDKTALTQQSLWTIFPDGTNETALFANNMVHPEATLDARPVPGSPHLVAATFTPHNAPPRGCVAVVDTQAGKNAPAAIFNFDTPDNPTHDRGDSCEPWPLSKDVLLYSGKPKGSKFNAIMLVDRRGRRVVVHAERDIDCHSPMLIKPRPRPAVLAAATQRSQRTGRLFVQDIYQGLTGVKRGEVKKLRVIEETSRTTGTHGGSLNQTFLMSGVLAWSAKNFLGVVDVEADGSAYFEVPSGRAIYLQALDEDGRLVRSMRTFIQAAPGVTRSCIGCHEYKYGSPQQVRATALSGEPQKLRDESWGSGYVDFPEMIQPILDKHCVRCHGGEKGFSGGLDLTGGWTELFSISYENLISRHRTQLTADLIAGIDCMNGTALWSAQIFPPRGHGSGAAPLAKVLVSGHKGRIKSLSRAERDLVLAWIDTNGLFHGTWNYADGGAAVRGWKGVKNELTREMQAAGCVRCHGGGRVSDFEDDWFNLRTPRFSRILRAPLAKTDGGLGLALCRNAKVDPSYHRVRVLFGAYIHAVTPLEKFKPIPAPEPQTQGEPAVTFASTDDPHYQAMLAIIRRGREQALAHPRTDMPGAVLHPGKARRLIPVPLPDRLPELVATADADGLVRLSWERSARTIGLSAELHRGEGADFAPTDKTLLATTSLHRVTDANATPGMQYYAMVLISEGDRSAAIRASVDVPMPPPPPAPADLAAIGSPGRIDLTWRDEAPGKLRYHVYRTKAGAAAPERLTTEPILAGSYCDTHAEPRVKYAYTVRAVNRRNAEGPPCGAAEAASLPEVKDPMFVAGFAKGLDAMLYGGKAARARKQGKARVTDSALDLREGGYVTFAHRGEFDLARRITVECWVHFSKEAQMPVVVSCGRWQQAGWFLQRIGAGWRWHVGGIDCDGGKPARGRWTHLVGTFDGAKAQLFQDGRLVATRAGSAILTPWTGPLHVGQYSGGPAPQYQVNGWIADLKIYNRPLAAEEVAAAAKAAPAARKP